MGVDSMVAGDEKVQEMVEKLDQNFRKYIFFEDDIQYRLTSIYVLFTHLYEIFDEVPYLQVLGLKGSGKTRLGDLFEGLCFNPVNSSEFSDASLYREIARQRGNLTLIIDEADDLGSSKRRSTLLRILRSGYRRNGNVVRCGPDGRPEHFSTFCPKVIINDGGIQDPALESRTIPLHMIRSPNILERFRFSKVGTEFKEARELIYSFCDGYRDTISDHYTSFEGIHGISGRDEEIWTPIIVIADVLATILNTPSVKAEIVALGRKIVLERRRKQLIENRDAQILESTRVYIDETNPLDSSGLYVGEALWRFIKDRSGIPDLKLETVSRTLNRYNIIKDVKRLRLGKEIRDQEIEVQRSCYLIDREKLASLTNEYHAGGEIL
jgi:hypothetical protein